MAGDLMSLSYAGTGISGGVGGAFGQNLYQNCAAQLFQTHDQFTIAMPPMGQSTITVATPPATPTERRTPVAKLIRFTVVDADPVLVREQPSACILLEGRRMLGPSDDKGFLMDLAPEVAVLLEQHNTLRGKVEYEDNDGKTRTLKPVRLGQLDVVVEVLKSYDD